MRPTSLTQRSSTLHNRALAALALALVTLLAAAGPALATSDLWFHVTVNESGGDNANITVNLPISVVDAALAMIPEEEMRDGRIRIDDTDFDVVKLRSLWREVQNTPDMTFVTVQSDDADIAVSKDGDYLIARTTEQGGDGAEVFARIPMSVVEALLSGNSNELNIAAAIQALADHGPGELVTVNSNDATVRVWIDYNPEAR